MDLTVKRIHAPAACTVIHSSDAVRHALCYVADGLHGRHLYKYMAAVNKSVDRRKTRVVRNTVHHHYNVAACDG